MGIFQKLAALATGSITGSAVKAVTGAGKDVTGMAKDVTGIQRDRVETKIAEHKLEELERRISPATLDDVEKYDPKVARIRQRTLDRELRPCAYPAPWRIWIIVAAVVALLVLLAWYLMK